MDAAVVAEAALAVDDVAVAGDTPLLVVAATDEAVAEALEPVPLRSVSESSRFLRRRLPRRLPLLLGESEVVVVVVVAGAAVDEGAVALSPLLCPLDGWWRGALRDELRADACAESEFVAALPAALLVCASSAATSLACSAFAASSSFGGVLFGDNGGGSD